MFTFKQVNSIFFLQVEKKDYFENYGGIICKNRYIRESEQD